MKPSAMRLLSLFLALILLFAGCQNPKPETSSPALESSAASSVRDASAPEPVQSLPSDATINAGSFEPHGDFIWEVTGGTGSVYLMGTMHVIKPSYALTPGIVALLDEADALAVEANMLSPSIYVDMLPYMTYPDYSSIFDHLSARGQEYLRNMCREYGINEESVEMYHPVTVSSVISGSILEGTDFLSNGVDILLLLRANELLIPILELEDFRDYFNALRSLDDDTLERVCVMTIGLPDDDRKGLEAMYDVYLSGEDEAMLAILNGDEHAEDEEYFAADGLPVEFEEKDDLYSQYMLTDRNRIMADSIIGYINSDGVTFVAAGLAHFLGDDNIISLLEAEGYRVTRITFS